MNYALKTEIIKLISLFIDNHIAIECYADESMYDGSDVVMILYNTETKSQYLVTSYDSDLELPLSEIHKELPETVNLIIELGTDGGEPCITVCLGSKSGFTCLTNMVNSYYIDADKLRKLV